MVWQIIIVLFKFQFFFSLFYHMYKVWAFNLLVVFEACLTFLMSILANDKQSTLTVKMDCMYQILPLKIF